MGVASVGAALAALLVAAAPAAAARPCPRERGLVCSTLAVPLDRSGALPGTITLRYAIEPARRTPRSKPRTKVVLALSGGPGQSGVSYGTDIAAGIRPALRDHRLLVLDQRGTGRSHVLSCPELQGLGGLQAILPETAASCARRLGPQRNHYATADTVEDIEALRRRLGIERIALYGVSYGTWVAQEYARRYPTHVERLVLDSVVASNDDPYGVGTVRAMARVLRDLCHRDACARITRDPFADLGAVLARMRRDGGALRGTIRDPDGGRRSVTLTASDLLVAIVSSDLNPYLRLHLPAALAAARAGDPVPLLRIRPDLSGTGGSIADLSAGLFVATTCADARLPYGYDTPMAQRPGLAAAALAAIPARDIAPFDRATIDRSSAPQICLQWPAAPVAVRSPAPLPRVPTLVLSGRDDLRTPLEGARTVVEGEPGAELVVAARVGHDVLGSDSTGCALTALRRFMGGRAVGSPCRRRVAPARLAPVPPRRLADAPRARGVPGTRGRVAWAALAAIADARATSRQALYAGADDSRIGGLRSGLVDIVPTPEGELFAFHRDVYVPGVAVSGSLASENGKLRGRLRVRAGRWSGTLRFGARRVTGRLGGLPVRLTVAAASRPRL